MLPPVDTPEREVVEQRWENLFTIRDTLIAEPFFMGVPATETTAAIPGLLEQHGFDTERQRIGFLFTVARDLASGDPARCAILNPAG